MSDIELVIKIPEGTKEQIIALTNLGESFPPKLQERIVRAIINGTPLPKGHGDLIDRKDLDITTITTDDYSGNEVIDVVLKEDVDGASAIIEADKGEE